MALQAESKWLVMLENELNAEMQIAPSISPAHDAAHIQRVWRNAKRIANHLEVDDEILIAAVYLHDLGRHYPEGSGVHGPVSAPLAEKVLLRIGFPADKIPLVLAAIHFHDETFTSQDRPSLEAKVLYDADKLDAFGAIGVARSLTFYTRRGQSLAQTIQTVRQNLPLRFQNLELSQTRALAQEMLDYTLGFYERLESEL